MDRELRSGKEINEDKVPHHGDTGNVSTEEMESGGSPSLAKRPRPDDVTADSTGGIEEDTGGEVADGKESDQPPRAEMNITPETCYGRACPICGFVAKTPTSLKIHSKRKHTGRGKTRGVSSAEVLVEIDGSTTGATARSSNYKTGGDTEWKVSSRERQQDATESQGSEAGGSEGEVTTIIAKEEIAEIQGTGRDAFDRKRTPIATEEIAEEEQEKTPGKKMAGKRGTKPKTIHACSYCGHEFKDKPSLDTHIKRRHTKEMNYFCEFCLYACVAKCDYEKHCLSNKHNKRVTESRESSGLSSPTDKKTAEQAQIFASTTTQTWASKRALGARFQLQCGSCEFRVSNSALLESHARLKHHGEHRFLCNVCHYYTATSEWMDTHVSSESHQRVAEEKNTGSSFEDCVEKVSVDAVGDDMLTDDVAVGVIGHDGELHPDVNEDAVEAAKAVLENMEEHMDERIPPKRRRGRPKGPAATTCEHCGLLASNSTNLNVHIRRKHSRQYSFTCRLCSYNCVTKGDMDRHCVTKKHLKRAEDASSDGQVDLDTSVQVVSTESGSQASEGEAIHQNSPVRGGSKGEGGATDKEGELSQDDDKAQVSSPKKSKYDLVNSCSHCMFVAHSIPSLDLHVKRRHTRDFEFVCLACSYYAVTRREMSRHASTDKHKQKSEVYLENLESFVAKDLAQPEEEATELGNRADPDADNNARTEDPSPSVPSDTDMEQPTNTDTTTDQPNIIDTDQPNNTDTDQLPIIDAEKPTDTDADQPTDTDTDQLPIIDAEKPTDTDADQPTDTDQPNNTDTDQLPIIDAEKPTDTDADQPTDTDQPNDTDKDQPPCTDTDQPTNTDTDQSKDIDQPNIIDIDQPNITDIDQPNITDTDQPPITNTEQPTDTATDHPTDTKHPTQTSDVLSNEHAAPIVEVSGIVAEENTEIQVAGEASGGVAEQTSNEAPGTIDPQVAPAEITITPPEEGQKEGAEAEPVCSDDDVEMADEKPDISSPEKQLTRALPFDACIVPLKSLTEAELALHEERMAHSVEDHSGPAVSGLTGAGSFQKIKRTKPVGASGLSKRLTPNPRIRCEDCGFVADGMSGLNVHISMKHPSKEKHFHCMLCGKSFYTESNLHQHLTSAAHLRNEQASIEELPEGGATFKCVKCTDPFETEQELFVHIKEKHEELLREVNKYVLEDTEQINREREENQGSVCKHCGKVCMSSNSMAFLAHIRTHTGSKPFKCKICNFSTAQLGDARNHVKRHLGMREYKCHICGWAFVMKKHLSTHLLGKHGLGQPKERKFECDLCDRSFSEKWALNNHMKLHTGDKPHKCAWPSCHYAFLTLSAMKDHYRTHTGEKSFLCDLCGFAGGTRHALTKHRRQHTGERPFKCQLCGFASTTQSHLTRHKRVHTGEKPYQCPWCDYRSNCAENIRKHILHTGKHEGVKMYNCPKCDYGTNGPMDFRNHLKEHHPDIENPDLAYLHAGIVSKSFECRLKGQGATFVEVDTAFDGAFPVRRVGSMEGLEGQEGVQQVIIIQGYGSGEMAFDQALEESAAATLRDLAMAGQVAEVLHITEDGQVISSGREVSAGGAHHLAGGTTRYVLLESGGSAAGGHGGHGGGATHHHMVSESSTALDALLSAVSEMGQQEEDSQEVMTQEVVSDVVEEEEEAEVKTGEEVWEEQQVQEEQVVQEVLQFAASHLMKEGLTQVIVNDEGTHYIVTELDDNTLQVEGTMYTQHQGGEDDQQSEGVSEGQAGERMVYYLDGTPHNVVLEKVEVD
ncbi:zinc finger protein 407 [Oncorhynchus mykiss]|uniref:Zinc finger protein 407 n=1 Tax=Oncorhynchus mykiss TaxID=8022 RepID=A0A8K9XBB2_ONCMY|nr:zinc finger protein 407 [Oncorhynchus mykiss]XP_036829731.1 zinc finger protein 407 [Oncorhynchus mykiss]